MTKKPAVRLSYTEIHAVYIYALENGALYQNGEDIKFRVPMDRIAKEINTLNKLATNKQITAHHVKTSIDTVLIWQKLLNRLPISPAAAEELDKISNDYNNKIKEIEVLRLKINEQQKEIQRLTKLGAGSIEVLNMKIDRIKAIVNS